jgi:hypothetical protein
MTFDVVESYQNAGFGFRQLRLRVSHRSDSDMRVRLLVIDSTGYGVGAFCKTCRKYGGKRAIHSVGWKTCAYTAFGASRACKLSQDTYRGMPI